MLFHGRPLNYFWRTWLPGWFLAGPPFTGAGFTAGAGITAGAGFLGGAGLAAEVRVTDGVVSFFFEGTACFTAFLAEHRFACSLCFIFLLSPAALTVFARST